MKTTSGATTELTLKTIQKAVKTVESIGRKPVFIYSLYADEVYHGTGIDDIASKIYPGFDPRFHKGYLVPEKHRLLVESVFKEGWPRI